LSRLTKAAIAATLVVLAIPVGASAATKTNTAGPPLKKAPPGVPNYADATQFFRSTVTIHAGDSVKWSFAGFHTVYFPKKSGKNVPLIVRDATRTYAGVLDPAGQPFWFNGQQQLIGNPKAVFPAGGKNEDGTKANNSGAPENEKFTYKLKFPKTGTFTYYCTIHPGMKGQVKVVSKKTAIPSAADDKAAVAAQVAATLKELKRNNARKAPSGNVIDAGRDTLNTSLLHFFPDTKTVPVGSTVVFRMPQKTNEIHTVTFGSAAVLGKGGYNEKLTEALLSPLPGTGQNGPPVLGVPGPIAFPSDPGPLSFDGTQHGGFVNSGLLGGSLTPGLPTSTRVTFTQPGTYSFQCLVHPEMRATVTVQ
jgi:plastocyanin